MKEPICRQYKIGVSAGWTLFKRMDFWHVSPIIYHMEFYYGNDNPKTYRDADNGVIRIELIAEWFVVMV